MTVFSVDYITIPLAVYNELKKAKFFDKLDKQVVFNENDLSAERWILVKSPKDRKAKKLSQDYPQLGLGEAEAMILAEAEKDILLMNDVVAQKVAKNLGLNFYGIQPFLLACKHAKILNKDQTKKIIDDLKKKDFYEFSDEMIDTLLE